MLQTFVLLFFLIVEMKEARLRALTQFVDQPRIPLLEVEMKEARLRALTHVIRTFNSFAIIS